MTLNKEDIFLNSMLSMISNKSEWSGTMTDLTRTLGKSMTKDEKQQVLSSNPSMMRRSLNKIVNRLRARGISVKFSRSKERLVKFVM